MAIRLSKDRAAKIPPRQSMATAPANLAIAPAPEIAMPQWTIPEATPPGATVIGSPSNPVGDTVSGNTTLHGNYVIYGNIVINGNFTVLDHYLVEDGSITVNGNATVQGSLTVFGGRIVLNGNVTQSQGGTLALAAFTANRQPVVPPNSSGPGSIVLRAFHRNWAHVRSLYHASYRVMSTINFHPRVLRHTIPHR